MTGDKGRQKGDKADTSHNDQQEGKQEGRQKETEGRQGGHSDQQAGITLETQMNRNASWPAEKGGHQQCRHRTWETKGKKMTWETNE